MPQINTAGIPDLSGEHILVTGGPGAIDRSVVGTPAADTADQPTAP